MCPADKCRDAISAEAMLKKGAVREHPATAIIMAVIVAEDADTKSL
jgi:hypothetical protein